MRVTVEYEGTMGFVDWDDDDPKKFTVEFAKSNKTFDAKIKEVRKHLTKIREIRIPLSNKIDHYKIVKVRGTKDGDFMQIALNTLHADTEVWVHW